MNGIYLRHKFLFLLLIFAILPATFAQPKPTKCGFSILAEQRGMARTAGLQASRPELQNRYLTKDSLFLIHYDLTGNNAVDPQSTNDLGIPDYIYETEKALHKAHTLIAGSLGFRLPPMDKVGYPEDPPGGARDFYIIENVPLSSYGWTQPEDLVSEPGEPEAYTSYTIVDNDFEEDFYFTHGIDALRVTLAHELFHHFHVGYVLDWEQVWWYEISSSWFEDVAYPGVNDYVQYVGNYFNNPEPLAESGGYSTAHYGHVLSDYKEPGLLNDIWTAFIDTSAYAALESTLKQYGSSFAQSYQRFAGWNLLTGNRAVPGFGYPDADLFPEIKIDSRITIPDSLPVTKTLAPRNIEYYEVFNSRDAQFYQVDFTGDGALLKGAFALANDGEILREFGGGQSIGINLYYRNYSGMMAIANGGENTETLKIDQKVKILRAYPNPYVRQEHSQLKLFTVLTEKSELTLHVFNIRGQKLFTYRFGSTEYESGPRTLTVPMDVESIRELGSGVYFLRLEAGTSRQSTKLVLIQ